MTRNEAFAAVAALNAEIAQLNCADLINGAKYMHEIDNGYGKLESAADVIKPLAAHLWFIRHEAAAVSIPHGSYEWAGKLCERATSLVHQIKNIEMRAAA